MTLNRILTIISGICLLITAVILGLAIFFLTTNGISREVTFLLYLGILTLAFAVTFVASYRQLFKQRPQLLLIALCLTILSEIIGFTFLQRVMSDPLTADMNATIRESIQKGLEDGTIPRGQGWEEQMTDNTLTIKDVLSSLAIYFVLFALPLYTNFRKPHPKIINP